MNSRYYDDYENTSIHLSLKFWILLFLICCFFGLCIYKAREKYMNDNKEITEKEELGANVSINFDNNTNIFTLEDLTPTKDYLGKSSGINKYFDFSVDIHLKQAKKVEYEVSLKKDIDSTLDDSFIHIYLEKKSVFSDRYESVFEPSSFISLKGESDLGTPKGNMLLHSDTSNETRKDYYRLRLWVVDGSLVAQGSYSVKVVLNAKAE